MNQTALKKMRKKMNKIRNIKINSLELEIGNMFFVVLKNDLFFFSDYIDCCSDTFCLYIEMYQNFKN